MRIKITNGVPERIIMNISEENNYASKIIRNIGSTQAHCVEVMRDLREKKIITQREKDGRKVHIELTDKGKEIRYHLNAITTLLI